MKNIENTKESIYEKHKNNANKLDIIEKELKEIHDFILSKKEYVRYELVLQKIKNKK